MTHSASTLDFLCNLGDNTDRAYVYALLEQNLAAVASRSSLAGTLLRAAVPANRHHVVDFLRGLSRTELECIAEFQGACILEGLDTNANPYILMREFFDPWSSERWQNAEDRAQKTLVVLSWLEHNAVKRLTARAAA